MSNDSPTNLPPAFRNGLLALEPFLAANPGLAVGIVSIVVEDECVTASWAWTGQKYAEQQAVAKAHPNLLWKRRCRGAAFDWYTVSGPVTIVLPRAEPVHLDYGPNIVDFDKLTPISSDPMPEDA